MSGRGMMYKESVELEHSAKELIDRMIVEGVYTKPRFEYGDGLIRLDMDLLKKIAEPSPEPDALPVLKVLQEKYNHATQTEKKKIMAQMDGIIHQLANPYHGYEHYAKAIIQGLEDDPETTFNALKKAIDFDFNENEGIKIPIRLEFVNYPVTPFNQVNFKMMGKFLQLEGWVGYLENPPHIEYSVKSYTCQACKLNMESPSTPKQCDNCGSKGPFEFDPEASEGYMCQSAFLMENFDSTTGTPSLLSVSLLDGINKYHVGDKIRIAGFLSMFKTRQGSYLFLKEQFSNLLDSKNLEPTNSERERFNEIAKDPMPFMARNIAPTIVGDEYNIIKQSIALAIVGGTEVEGKRSDIHILMVGDPGVGKSEIMKSASRIAPKALFVSDASGPGVTASIADLNGSRVMIPGVLPMGNHGVVFLDELDKMRKDDSAALHAAMEQGEFTKSKAGLIMKFETKTTVIAAANPTGSRFDPSRGIMEQIDIEQSLLERFDLIWIMHTPINMDIFEMVQNELEQEDPILMKYFHYARKIQPEFPPEMAKEVNIFFQEIRSKSGDLSVSARVGFAMKRIAEASAKLHLRARVEYQDIILMKNIISAYLQPFNFSISNIAVSQGMRQRLSDLLSLKIQKRKWKKEEILQALGWDELELDKALEVLKHDGSCYEPANGRVEFL